MRRALDSMCRDADLACADAAPTSVPGAAVTRRGRGELAAEAGPDRGSPLLPPMLLAPAGDGWANAEVERGRVVAVLRRT